MTEMAETVTVHHNNKTGSVDYNNDPSFADQKLKVFLNSDVSVNVLLLFFKNSIINCEFLIKCIKRKSNTERDYLNDLVKEYKHVLSDSNNISYGNNSVSQLTTSILDIFKFDNYIISVRENYINELNNILVELSNLLSVMVKYRKFFKDKIKVIEKNIHESITVSEKYKRSYISLCLDYEKLKLNKSNSILDNDPIKMKLSIRSSKPFKEQEAELLKKIENADYEYKEKVASSTTLRNNLIDHERPEIVNNLISFILEFENSMTLQLTKMAILKEKLIVNMGLIVSPIDNKKYMSLKSCSEKINPKLNLVNFLDKIIETKTYSNNYVNDNLVPLIYSKHPIMQNHDKKRKKSLSKGKSSLPSTRSRSNSASSLKNHNNGQPTFAVDPSRNSIPKGMISTHNETPFNLSTQPSMNTLNITSYPPDLLPLNSSNAVKRDKAQTIVNKESKPLRVVPNDASKGFSTLDPGSKSQPIKARIPSLSTIDSDNVSIYSRVRPSPTRRSNNIDDSSEERADSIGNKTNSSVDIQDDVENKLRPDFDESEQTAELKVDESTSTNDKSSSINDDSSKKSSIINELHDTSDNNPKVDNSETNSANDTSVDVSKDIIPIFGTPLNILFNLEEGTVPTIVRQCIHVVEKYGLELEGIYRNIRETEKLNYVIDEINNNPAEINTLIPPQNHTETDIYLIATLLKTYFSKLPETLIPYSISEGINVCLAIEDRKTQIDYMHGLIYNFDDYQYWTLRSLLFHLKNVVKNEKINKMNLKALSIIWGPAILPKNETDINDVDYHHKLLDILCETADQAFEAV